MSRQRAQQGVSSTTRRGLLLGGGLLTAFAGLGWRLYDLQIARGADFRTLAEDNRFNFRVVAPPRGLILDRYGVVLAGLRDNLRILVTPERAPALPETLEALAPVLNLTARERAAILSRAGEQPEHVPILVREDVSWDEFAAVNARAPELPGVLADVSQVRSYPFGPVFSHITGYVGAPDERDVEREPVLRHPGFRVGRAGVESHYDERLRGEPGALKVEVNAHGRVVRELPNEAAAATSGEPVQLTLDAAIQTYTHERLGEESAGVCVMNVWTGELLGLVSTPAFDANTFSLTLPQEAWQRLRGDERKPLLNKAVAGIFPPGSTFKMVVALAALREGWDPDEVIPCYGHIPFGGRDFNCWRERGHGPLDLKAAIYRSCDVYFYEIAKVLKPESIARAARDYGLGEAYDLPLSSVRAGTVPDPTWKRANLDDAWYGGDTLNYAIGQGYATSTPLELAVMTARLATGARVRPHLVTTKEHGAMGPPAMIPDRPEHLALVRSAMHAVVHATRGTARGARLPIPGLQIAGKTGTAQVRYISKGEREAGIVKNEELPWHLRDHALFVAYAPADKPTYAVSVIVEHGGGGSSTAAPIARDILAKVLERDPAGRVPRRMAKL